MQGVQFLPASLTQAENVESLREFGKVEACEDPRNTDHLYLNPIEVIGQCLSHFEYAFKHLKNLIPLTCCPTSAALLAHKPTNCTTPEFPSLLVHAAKLAWSGQVEYHNWLSRAFATVGETSAVTWSKLFLPAVASLLPL